MLHPPDDALARNGNALAEMVRERVPLSRLALRFGIPREMLVRELHDHIGLEIAALSAEVDGIETPTANEPTRPVLPPEPVPGSSEVVTRKRLTVPPITGKGVARTFRVALHDDGVTRVFIVAAYGREQAARLLQCSEIYLKRYSRTATDEERERAEAVPGQVWVKAPGALNFIKWEAQPGARWI
jgi:hypothetical protein